jgi:hypothetical protein
MKKANKQSSGVTGVDHTTGSHSISKEGEILLRSIAIIDGEEFHLNELVSRNISDEELADTYETFKLVLVRLLKKKGIR